MKLIISCAILSAVDFIVLIVLRIKNHRDLSFESFCDPYTFYVLIATAVALFLFNRYENGCYNFLIGGKVAAINNLVDALKEATSSNFDPIYTAFDFILLRFFGVRLPLLSIQFTTARRTRGLSPDAAGRGHLFLANRFCGELIIHPGKTSTAIDSLIF